MVSLKDIPLRWFVAAAAMSIVDDVKTVVRWAFNKS